MAAKSLVGAAARNGYENTGGLIAFSLAVTLAFVPVVAAAGIVGTVEAILGGFWATSLLLGIVVVAACRFATAVATRGVSVDLRSAVEPAVRGPVPGLELGVATFGVLVVAAMVSLAVPLAYRPIGVGVATFSLTFWYLLVAFAVPEFGAGRRLGPALRAGGVRVVESPGSAALFLVLTCLCTVVAGVTVVTTALLLPGVLVLLAAQTTAEIDADERR